MYEGRARYDDLVWDENDAAQAELRKTYFYRPTIRKLEAIATKKLGRTATFVSPIYEGSYNFLYRMRVEGSDKDVMFRLLSAHSHQFPDEKILQETATAHVVLQRTNVTTAGVLSCGLSKDCAYGPFTIISYVENSGAMTEALMEQKPTDPQEGVRLDANIPKEKLESYFQGTAALLLQLFEPRFPRIGSLAKDEWGSVSVAGRPITQNMSNMVQLANIPRAVFPSRDKTYGTANEWYVELARMHMAQLVFQHNDLVQTADDCRNKYVARQLFHRLAKDGRLSTFGFAEDRWSAQSQSRASALRAPCGSDSFRLWCDDWGTSNILLGGAEKVVAFIDWEFSYVAPTQFILDPPSWLLLDDPEMWKGGIDAWARRYEACLETWVRAVERAERGPVIGDSPISAYMRESWESGRFWLNYAARKSWAFDTIYWKYLDEKFYGERGEVAMEDLWKTRVHMLDSREKAAMEPFVEMKMEETKERILVEWTERQVRERLANVLFED